MIGLLGAALAGCVGAAPVNTGTPTLEIVSGNDQSADVGTTLALPFVVIVKDANRDPMAGVTVTFELQSGGGSLSTASIETDGEGLAQTTLTVGALSGPNTVIASAPGVAPSPVTFTVAGTAPTTVMYATHIKPLLDASCVGCHQAGGAAQFAPLTTYAQVRFGNSTSGSALVVPGSPDTSVLAQKVQPTGSMYSMLGADDAARTTNAKTITDWITAGALNTEVGAPAKIQLVSGDHQSATVASALPEPLVVRVVDANDNPVPDVWVDFAIESGGGAVGAAAVKTDMLGLASSTHTLGSAAGASSVTASVKGVAAYIRFESSGTAGTATQIALVSGNNQNTTVGTALTNPLVVAVKDAGGNPVAGFMVTFTAATGGGTVSAATVETDAAGLAQSTLTVGTTAGTNTVTVNASGLTGSPVTFTAMGNAGAAAAIALVSGNNQSATVGTALTMPFVVAVTDDNGNPVAGTAVTFAVATGGGSLSATSVTTNAQGQAQTKLTVGSAAGMNTVTATRAGLTGSPVTFVATGTTGTATQIAVVSGGNQSATVGSTLNPFVVVVKDAAGNPVDGFSVAFTVVSGGGSLSALSILTNAQGQAQTTLTLGSTAGTNTVTANATGLTGSPITFTATGTAGAATKLSIISGNNQTAKVGTALTNPFVVKLEDANGNPVSGAAVNFAVTAGGGTLSAATATTNAMGLAQSTLTVGTTVGANTVTASKSGLPVVTFNASATSGTASQIALVSGNNQSAPVGTALASPFVVAVKDANGNAVSGFSVTFSVVTGSGTLSAATAMTNAQGQASTTLTFGATAGTTTVRANATGLSGSPVVFTATATAAAATQMAIVSGNNQTARVGSALAAPLVVVAKDASGNGVPGVTITFAVTGGGGSISATNVMTNAQGQASTTLTVGSMTGTNTVTATKAGLTGSPITFTAAARSVTFTDDVQPILVARCVNCHMAGGTASFTPLTTYTQVRFGVSFSSGAALVVPNDPAGSVLVAKTQSSGSMYSQLGADTATRDANARIIRDWVAQGALNTTVGAATQIVMTSGNNQSGSVSTALNNPFVVTVMDANMNPVSGHNVTFAVTAGGGTLSATTVATSAQGTAGSTLTLGPAAGTNTVTASASGLTGSPITFSAMATAGAYSGAPLAGSTNPFDVAGLVAMKAANVEPAALSGDGEFIRRVTADLAGRLPTLDEYNTFVASTDPTKRAKLIDTLLASADFGKHWGLDVLAAWLTVDKDDSDATDTDIANFENYLIAAATNDKPLSSVINDLATGSGTGGAAFDVINMKSGETYKAADRLMETFTGIPSKCARCHDSKIVSPADDPQWTMTQNRGLYKFFEPTTSGTLLFVVDGVSSNPTNLPAATDSQAIRRARFGTLLAASKAFPRGTGHRIFAEVMQPLLNSNRILAQAVADVKVPKVLEACSSVFTAQNTSLKGFLRVLLNSRLYQLTTKGTTVANDAILARHTLRRHAAEVLEAGIVSVTGIADSTSARDDFYSKFGYAMDRTVITERSFAVNTIQPLTLLNNPSSAPGKVTNSTGVIAGLASKVDGGTMTLDGAITEIFRRALSRDPTAAELTALKSELSTATTNKEKLEDVAVVVMASTEFSTR